ncbi:WD40-repeat-containing domain protein [Melanogaster broomeanus]|nr:WD40-repeat-containing domain protein [Melanogaster broomeanus]
MPTSPQSGSMENVSHRLPVQVFEGHKSSAACVCFYPDENKLVSGSHDNTLCIWDRGTGAMEVLSGHTGAVYEVDVSRDGKMVVSGSADTTVRVWDGESGQTMHVFEGHRDWVHSVQFSPDSSRVVSLQTGKLPFEPIQCDGIVQCVRFSPSGDRIASGTGDTIQIWDAATGNAVQTIEYSWVHSLAWTPDSDHIVGGREGDVVIWNSCTGERLRTWKPHNFNDWIRLSLSPAGAHLATHLIHGTEKTVLVFDVSTGQQVAAFEHDGAVEGIAYSPSGRFIATVCDTKVYLWEAPDFEDPRTEPRPPSVSLLDLPAIPLPVGMSRNAGPGFHGFEESLPDVATSHSHASPQRQASSMHRWGLNNVGDTLTNLFSRRPAVVARNTIQSVQVAEGRDRAHWFIIEPMKLTPMKRFLYMLVYCRKPLEDEDEEVAEEAKPDPSQTLTGDAVITTNQEDSTVPPSPWWESRPPTQPWFPAVASHTHSSSILDVTSIPLSASKNARSTSTQPPPQDDDRLSTSTLSPEEREIMVVAEPLSIPPHNREASVYPEPSASTPNGSLLQPQLFHQPSSRLDA